MGEPEKPLHVRVAEALGCSLKQVKGASPFSDVHPFYWACGCPMPEENLFAREHGSDLEGIRRYDTDWSATGPLIEKYGICVNRYQAANDQWWASRWVRMDLGDPLPPLRGKGPTPLVAVCNLILKLHGRGSLDAPAS